jgi:hypothetical protein
MNKLLFFIFFYLGATACGAQIYFNNVYDDTTHLSESSSNIVLLDDGTFLVPSAFQPSQGEFQVGYGLRRISAVGVELSQHTIIPYQDYLMATSKNPC